MSAAIVDPIFRSQLLEDPLEAVRLGYLGQSFSFTEDERDFLASITARDFQHFSDCINQWISRNGHRGPTDLFTNDEGL